mmetsp:Transcript_5512/g.21542  ORF Transcript_5512/g.21542 Transcript_5512/m.21542 type:complete len:246 (-) Transcript_5512:2468-3205(-)
MIFTRRRATTRRRARAAARTHDVDLSLTHDGFIIHTRRVYPPPIASRAVRRPRSVPDDHHPRPDRVPRHEPRDVVRVRLHERLDLLALAILKHEHPLIDGIEQRARHDHLPLLVRAPRAREVRLAMRRALLEHPVDVVERQQRVRVRTVRVRRHRDDTASRARDASRRRDDDGARRRARRLLRAIARARARAPARRGRRRRATAREVRARAEREGGGATEAKDDETGGADAARARARGRRARWER